MVRVLKTRHLLVLFFLQIFCILYAKNTSAQTKIQQFDDRIMIDLAEHRTPEQTGFFMFLSKYYIYGDIGVPVGLLAGGIIGNNKNMRDNGLFVASSTVVSYGFTALIKHIVKRRRPFVQNINITPVYRASGYSFPSGHSSSTFATATALSIAYKKWYVIAPAYAWAGATAYSRMYLGVHYPTDVASGILLGTGSAAAMSFLRK